MWATEDAGRRRFAAVVWRCRCFVRGSKRLVRRAAGAFVLVLAIVAPTAADAHPLGNFSVNHQTRVQISRDRVDLLYVLDQAEIPTFQERGLGRKDILARKLAEVREDLWLIVDGRRRNLRLSEGPRLTFPPGQGGLRITRVELPFRVAVDGPKLVEVRDLTFGERVGWVDLVAVPGRGTRVATAVSPMDPTDALRDYRGISLRGVPDQVRGKFLVGSGKGSLLDLNTGATYGASEGPALRPKPPSAGSGAPSAGRVDRGDDEGFAGVFERASQGEGVFVFMLLAAFAWGAFHALSPGHGKAMVAAYLVGTRGTAKQAVALGGIVTVTHTIGVFALGVVTLVLAQYVLPEDLYPWLNLFAGLLILLVGIGVLRSRLSWRRRHRAEPWPGPDSHVHEDGEDHHHEHGHHHERRGHERDHRRAHGHEHSHGGRADALQTETTWRGLFGMGVSAGIIPCPSALVVLLAAISQHEIALGLLLIGVFSVGLACTLTGLGLAVVYAKRLMAGASERLSLRGRVASFVPALSTLVILGLGIVMTAKAVPDVL
jgi:nickel/cobalt exporter